MESLRQHEIVSSDLSKEFDQQLTFGEALSDKIAEFGGSWKFIILFGGVLIVWIIINGIILLLARLGSLSFYPFEPDPLLPCCAPGAHHYDEPESGRSARSSPRRQRL